MNKIAQITGALAIWISAILMADGSALAQERFGGIAEINKTVHDFGDILLSDGPQSCSFEVKNISNKPMLIHSVVTSCGCTGVKWTKEPVLPGKTGTISAIYTNDEGPYPFDKGLTVYISGIGKPIILRLRGISHQKQMPLDQTYPIHIGSLGLKSKEIKCGNIEQGESKSTEITIANISSSPITVNFADCSPNLTIYADPATIPGKSTAKVNISVRSDRNLWGKNWYYATPVVNGRKSDQKVAVFAFTKENFGSLTKADRENGSRPMFDSSSFTFGKIKSGTLVDAEFTFKNTGKADFKVFKADVDAKSFSISEIPPVKCGYDGKINVKLDTKGMPSGEALVIVTLTTNSPSRPIVNLFITGFIE